MKFLCSILLIIFSVNAFADSCDFSKGIKPLPNGDYEYSDSCHRKVGTLVKENKDQAQANDDLNKAIQLKDLALKQSDQRATLWSDTSNKLEDRITKIDSSEKANNLLYFGLGALTVLAAGFMTSSLIHK